MPKDIETEVIVEETIVDDVVETEVKPEAEVKPDKSYTQIRAERAAAKAQSELLKELGVTTLDEAKAKIEDGAKALTMASEIKAQLDAEAHAKVDAAKSVQLRKLFEGTFDPEVLVQLTDLSKVELDANGQLLNGEALLGEAKATRPRFFGQVSTQADPVAVNTQTPGKVDIITKAYEDGDYTKAVSEHLKSFKL